MYSSRSVVMTYRHGSWIRKDSDGSRAEFFPPADIHLNSCESSYKRVVAPDGCRLRRPLLDPGADLGKTGCS